MARNSVIDFVYSPDDGGWYAREMDLDAHRSRVTKRTYQSEKAAQIAVVKNSERVWERWP